MSKTSPRPGITHYLPAHRGALKTVAWQTRNGETLSVTGRITGWAVGTTDDTQYLQVRDGQHKVRNVPAVAIERHLAVTGQTRQPERELPILACRECGKTLDLLDDHSGLEGYCFDCV